ncbi:MAG: RecQ family ATP-dependent DNA helicase [Sphaerochaetaceae bacterium]|jgi:ATP-dependent DNA helicase RecQ|nr:RecQ family ATP-dependent DNA helicase [Sphaerochaetaceae bacterium]MDD4007735.1 RecQ family ATP-dependent DNA helicase [Sphaerochaetaceae bacterium]
MDIQTLMKTEALSRFGIASIKPYQNLVIQTILERAIYGTKNPGQLVVFPTGYGKSLCFMLPASILRGVTVIVYPLLALMSDQKKHMDRIGLQSELLCGGQSHEQRSSIWDRLQSGQSKIVITNPETLCTQSVISHLRTLKLELFTVDEAHVVCEWGQTFRPAYLQLMSAIRILQPSQVLAFTATASPAVIVKLKKCLFGGRQPHMVIADPDRSNIHYSTVRTFCRGQTLDDIARRCERPALVFCRTRFLTEKVFFKLKRHNPDSDMRYYHAGLDRSERASVERWFEQSNDGILVATCAYGLGMDKSNIRTVIHYSIPDTVEEFLQESGRAGRDSKQSQSIVMVPYSAITDSLTEPNQRRRSLLRVFADQNGCLRSGLMALMGREMQQCSGCDVCDGHAQEVPYEMETILKAVRRYPLRFGVNELACSLTAVYPRAGRSGFIYANALSSWTFESARSSIAALVRLGWLRSVRTGLRRKALVCPRAVKRLRFGPPAS